MNYFLADFSPHALAQAIEANQTASYADLGRSSLIALNDDPEILWFLTGLPFARFNRVLRARFQDDDVDAKGCCFPPQAIGETFQSVLGGMVPSAKGGIDLAAHRRDVDDLPIAVFPHTRQNQLSQSGKAKDIDFKLATSFIHRHILDSTIRPVPGIVDQDVYRPLFIENGLDAGSH